MALDLSLSHRARASVSSDTDSGYCDNGMDPATSHESSVRSANVSPVPKIFQDASSSFVHSAPVSPSCTVGITTSPPPTRSSSMHLAPPLLKPTALSPSRSSTSISSLATSSFGGSQEDQSEKMDISEPNCAAKRQQINQAFQSRPPKLISDKKTDRKSHRFHMDSLLAEGSHKNRKRNSLIPPPLQLTNNVFHSPSNLSPYDYRSRIAHQVSPYDIVSPHTPQRFNFDLMNLRPDLPVHSPVPISPYNPDTTCTEPASIFNFMAHSLPASPHHARGSIAASPLLPLSPLLTPSQSWACALPRPRLDSVTLDRDAALPFQPYGNLCSSPRVVTSEHSRVQPMRSPTIDDASRRNDARKLSPRHQHPYQILKDSHRQELDKASQVENIRRRIFSNVDLKTPSTDKPADRPRSAYVHRAVHKQTSPGPYSAGKHAHMQLHPGLRMKMAEHQRRMTTNHDPTTKHSGDVQQCHKNSSPEAQKIPTHSPERLMYNHVTKQPIVNVLPPEQSRANDSMSKQPMRNGHVSEKPIRNGHMSKQPILITPIDEHYTHKSGSEHQSKDKSFCTEVGERDSDEENVPPNGLNSPINSDGSTSSDDDRSSGDLDVETVDEVFDPLPADPREWNRGQVVEWLNYISTNHRLEPIDPARFLMNGKALCLMTQSMFLSRVPSGGRLLYCDFQNRMEKALSPRKIIYPLKKRKTLSI